MIILRHKQKEFNISRDAKRYKETTYKKALKEINSEQDRQMGKVREKAYRKASNNKPVLDRKTEINLLREGNKLGARAFRDPYNFVGPAGPSIVNTNTNKDYIDMKRDSVEKVKEELKNLNIPDKEKKEFRKIHGDSFKSKYHVKYPEGFGVDALSHEVGHIQNNNPILKEQRTKKQQYEEEKNSSENAIKLLKKSGLESSKLKMAKNNLKRELATYRPEMIEEELENKKNNLKKKFKKI